MSVRSFPLLFDENRTHRDDYHQEYQRDAGGPSDKSVLGVGQPADAEAQKFGGVSRTALGKYKGGGKKFKGIDCPHQDGQKEQFPHHGQGDETEHLQAACPVNRRRLVGLGGYGA